MIGETWGNMLRMSISRGLFHTHANIVPRLQLYSQQGQSLTTICQQCTKTCHSSYALAYLLNRSLVQILEFLDSIGHACSLQEGTSSYTSILWRRQRQGWRPIDAPSVVKPATIGATWGNTWKISTSPGLFHTRANTARPRWPPKLSPLEQNYKIMSPLFTSLFRSVLLTEVWTDFRTWAQFHRSRRTISICAERWKPGLWTV